MSSHLAAATPPPPEYKLGDVATADIVSPLHLIVIDHERTEKLRREEAQRGPAIFRFYPGMADEAEAGLRAAFTSAREKFFDSLEANYARHSLNEAQIALPRFQRLVASLQRQSKQFPLSTNLAQLWALGGSDEAMQTNLVARLREAMAHPIRTDPLPPEGKAGPRQVKMISVPSKDAAIDLALVEKQAVNVIRTNINVLWRARNELQASFPPEERATMGKFVASFLKANCVCDTQLTRQSRAKRTEAIWSADEYEAGQLIVKQGDLIDSRVKAVLDQLRERAAGEQARKDLSKGQMETQTAVAQLHEEEARARASAEEARTEMSAQVTAEQNRWLLRSIIGGSIAFVLVLAVVWRLARRKPSSALALLPASTPRAQITGTVISCPSCTSSIVLPLNLATAAPVPLPVPPVEAAIEVPQAAPEASPENEGQYWKARALAAESQAEKSNHILRAALIPHLARWLMSKVVRRLSWQRGHLLETQQKAEQELAELEQRLVAVKAPLEDRLKAYEQRIAELEKDLSAKGKENRELIEATIAMAKKKLESERSKDRVPWN